MPTGVPCVTTALQQQELLRAPDKFERVYDK